MRSLATTRRGRQVRRLDLVNLSTSRALREMRGGAVLYLSHTKSGSRWFLSTGLQLSPEVARAVTGSHEIIAVDRGLFGAEGQSWRWRNSTNEEGM